MPSHMTTKASPRPAKGTARKMQQARRRLIETNELAAKTRAKLRDGYACRRCGMTDYHGFCYWNPIEAAHIRSKGMGGDHGRHSHHQRDYVTLCHDCHQGPRSVHSGHVRIVVLGPKLGDGPVHFVDVKKPGAAA